MKDWEEALDKFIKPWKAKKYVVAALISGTYVTGKPDKFSDLDVQIICDDTIGWRQRGNEVIDGYVIEYFVNPVRQVKKYFEREYKEGTPHTITMLLTGKVIFDKKKIMPKLLLEAKKWNKPLKKLEKLPLEISKYHIWDLEDNLKSTFHSNNPDYVFVYHNALQKLYKAYSRFLQETGNHPHKTYLFLTSNEKRKQYLKKEFPDKTFAQLFVKAMIENKKSQMLKYYVSLTKHVLKEMGGFGLHGWKIRNKI